MQSGLIRIIRALLRLPIRLMKMGRLVGISQTLKFGLYWFFNKPRIILTPRGFACPVFCRPKTSDIFPMWQVFGIKEFDIAQSFTPEIIIDAGANTGYGSVFYAAKFPHARILAVEPDSENLEMVELNLKPFPNVQVVHGAIWWRNTDLVIKNPKADYWSFRVCEAESSEINSIPGFTIQTLLDNYGLSHVDLVKMDIEGAEGELFRKGDLEWLDLCRVLVIEVHGDSAFKIVDDTMKKRGFICKRKGEKLIYSCLKTSNVERGGLEVKELVL